ncbi:MAG: WD40 repeat domain-containing protein [Gemmataceae bacterium]|nr:WD40 repeat domain-containing protein [Gemmataceae bacterium]
MRNTREATVVRQIGGSLPTRKCVAALLALANLLGNDVALFGQSSQATDRHGDPLPKDALLRLGTTRFRNLNPNYAQFLPDGKTILTAASTSARQEIHWLDATTGRPTQSWPLPKSHLVSVNGFSPDGRQVLVHHFGAMPSESRLRIVDLQTKEFSNLQTGHFGDAVRGRFSPDGKFLMVNFNIMGPGLLYVFDVSAAKKLWQVGDRSDLSLGCLDLGFMPDRKTLVILEPDNKVSLRDCLTGRELKSFATLPVGELRTPVLSPDGKTIFFGTPGKSVSVWDVASGRELPPLGEHIPPTEHIAVSQDSNTVVTAGERYLLVWDWPSAKLRAKIDLGAGKKPRDLRISLDGTRAHIWLRDEYALRFFDLKTGKELPGPTEAHRSSIAGLAIAPDGKVVTAAADDTIRVWDSKTGRQVDESQAHFVLGAKVAFSADSRLLAAGHDRHGKVSIHERDSGKVLHTIDTGEQQILAVQFAPHKPLLAISAATRRVNSLILWNLERGQELRRLNLLAVDLAFSPDGRFLARADTEQVRLLDAATGREIMVFPEKWVRALAFSSDSRTLAAVGSWRVSVWECSTGKSRWGTVPRAGFTYLAVCFHPHGRWLAAANQKQVMLHDLFAPGAVETLAGHDEFVMHLAFAPDGSKLASGSNDTTVVLWDFAKVRARMEASRDVRTIVESDVEAAWDRLADSDAASAYRGIVRLVEAKDHSLPFLRKQLQPIPAPDAKQVEGWLADLGSAQFAVREKAKQELELLADLAEPAIQRYLTKEQSLEARRRAEAVLAAVQGPVKDQERLRLLRAVEALEFIGTKEARQILEAIAKGADAARVTREARESLQRIGKWSDD